MALVRWKDAGNIAPWSALQDLETEMSRLFGDFGRDWNWPERTWMPSADLRETEDHYIMELDIPGMNKEDLDITAIDNVLTVKGERKHEHKEGEGENGGYRRFERRYGRFERSFEIPGGFDSEKVEAHYEDGVLRIMLPKREETKPRHIDVKMN